MTAGWQPGARVRHYRILAPLARSGPGRTWAAFDPRLERRVTLRRIPADDLGGPEAATATLAGLGKTEALHDPRLVAVHEGWIDGGALFVAAEHAEAPTLERALGNGSIDAERAAAIGREIALGLASLFGLGLGHGSLSAHTVVLHQGDHVQLTHYGLLDPRAPDCARVVFAKDRADLCAVLAKLVAGPSADRGSIPRWLAEVLEAGNAPDRVNVFTDPTQLADALGRTPSRRRRRMGGSLLVGTLAVATAGVVFGTGQTTTSVCRGDEAPLAETWNAQLAETLDADFVSTGLPFAGDVSARVRSTLDAYVERWQRTRLDSCRMTHVEGLQSEEILDLKMACLEQRARELRATVGELAVADEEIVARAATMVDELPRPESCAELDVVSRGPAPEVKHATEAERARVRQTLATVRARRSAGRYDGALALVGELSETAQQVDQFDPDLRADLLLLHGDLMAKTGDPDPGARLLRQAVHAAWESGDDRMAVEAWTSLAFVEGDLRADHVRAERAIGHAHAALERLGGDDVLEAELRGTEGVLSIGRGEYARAVDLLRESIALRERFAEADSPRLASAYNNLGNALTRLAAYDDAVSAYDRAREIWRASIGQSHPDMASLHNNLGAVAFSRGDLDRAQREFELAFELREALLGPSHPQVAATIDNLGVVAGARGEQARALEFYRRALAIKREAHRGPHPAVADSLLNVGTALHELGRLDEALDHHRRALAMYRETLGDEHPWTALAVHNEARALAELGRLDEAIARHRAALSLRERIYGPDHPNVAPSHRELGEVLQKTGRRDSALEHLQANLRILQAAPEPDADAVEDARAALAAAARD